MRYCTASKKIMGVLIITLIFLIIITGCSDKELKVKEGELANGFVWKNNYSEITITGYEGSSNDIVIPEKINGKPVTKIATGAFTGFSKMKSAKVPGCVKSMESAFKDCTGLVSVELAEGIENINGAFEGCKSIKKVKVPQSVKEMERTFINCSSLETVNVPEGVVSLRETFSKCTSLTTIDLPESLSNLNGTFKDCKSLASILLPKKLTNIVNAFSGCTSLKKLEIPEGVIEITGAFQNCSALEILILPSSCTEGLYLDGLVNIKTITMSQESLANTIEEMDCVTKWTVCKETDAEWYSTLMQSKQIFSRTLASHMDSQTIDGIEYYYEEVWRNNIRTYFDMPAESQGTQTIEKTYLLASVSLRKNDIKVICREEIRTYGVYNVGEPNNEDVEINGTNYSIKERK